MLIRVKVTNYSLDFNNVLGVETSLDVNEFSQITFSFWFKTSTQQNSKYIISMPDGTAANGVEATFTNTSVRYRLTGQTTDTSIDATFTYYDDNWHHIVCTYDGSTQKIYVDGALSNSGSANNGTLKTRYNKLYIGSFNWVYGLGPDVTLDGVAIFDYALSASQVTTLYGTGSAIGNPMALPSPPIAYYPLGTSAWNGQYLAENNAIGDYVFDFIPNGYINIHDSSSLRVQNLTISLWVNAGTQSNNYRYFFEKGNLSYVVYTGGTTTDLLFLIYDGSSYYFSNALTNTLDNNWHHIAFTYDGSQIIGYKDGVANTPVSASGTILHDTNPLRIGSRAPSLGNYPSGKMSNVQIFNTALPATDVETLYNYGSPIRTLANIPQSSNLKAWYKLDASEIYNSTSTEWSVDNNKYPSTYNSSINLVRASSQKIDIANGSELDFTGDFTMSIWVNLTTSNNNMGIFNKTSQANSNGVTLFKRGGANFEFYVSEYSNVLTFASQGDNIWQQITITLNRTTGERVAYINGEQAATLTHIKTFAFPNQGWDIGTFATNSPNYLDAKVSNFKLFNTVLSPTEVQTLYNNGTPLTDMSSFTSLKGWWKLNNLSSGLTDSSSNSNNATITSGTNEYAGFVNALAGDSSGMNQSNLVQSDLQTVAPYSKYAMNFDGVSEKMAFNSSPIDLGLSSTETWWIKYSNSSATSSSIASAPVFAGFHILYEKSTNKVYYRIDSTNLYYEWVIPSTYFTDNLWHHYAIVRDDNLPFSSYIKLYIDGNLFGNPTAVNATSKSTTNTKITDWGGASAYPGIVGDFSNVAFWNTALTASEAKEIYNEGLPSNLHNFSGTAPVAWWQMGSNSSYVNGWICADEIGANNGATSNIGEESLVNGVGTTANGISTGMSEGSLIGNAPYSTANAVSSGMAVTAKGTDVP